MLVRLPSFNRPARGCQLEYARFEKGDVRLSHTRRNGGDLPCSIDLAKAEKAPENSSDPRSAMAQFELIDRLREPNQPGSDDGRARQVIVQHFERHV